jgi:hypothetical protein
VFVVAGPADPIDVPVHTPAWECGHSRHVSTTDVGGGSHHGGMTSDERFIIENAAADDDLDLLLATHRCADCAEYAFLEIEGEWLCVGCAEAVEREAAAASRERQAA